MLNPSIYLETSIIGNLTNRPSSNINIESHRQLTLRWWNEQRNAYHLVIADPVMAEISRGDPIAVRERLRLVDGLTVLPMTPAIFDTSAELVRAHALPDRALVDAMHIATCCHYRIDILLTWNCNHIANPHILKSVRDLIRKVNLWMPEVATPESLLGASKNVGPHP